jgi:hypothetical protein
MGEGGNKKYCNFPSYFGTRGVCAGRCASVAALCYVASPLVSIFQQEDVKEIKVILIEGLVRLLCMYRNVILLPAYVTAL